MKGRSGYSVDSWLVSGGRPARPGTPLNPPLIPASNFNLGGGAVYSREDGTESWHALEEVLGGLESARCVLFSSGMAAVAATLAMLPTDALVLLPEDCYQGVRGLVEDGVRLGRLRVKNLPLEEVSAWHAAMPAADFIWLETPSNPLLTVADVEAICKGPRKPGTVIAVDNTFATPINQQPLSMGADLAIQSATKFIGGHSDLLAGAVTTRSDQLFESLVEVRKRSGATPGALEVFLALRGSRTMALRLDRAQENALILAERLETHPQIERVLYPGLPSHPSFAVAQRVLNGPGSILSYQVRGNGARAESVCQRARLIHHATSLGSVESTMERRAGHGGQERIPQNLIRLSVGCEDVEDLWSDLNEALVPA